MGSTPTALPPRPRGTTPGGAIHAANRGASSPPPPPAGTGPQTSVVLLGPLPAQPAPAPAPRPALPAPPRPGPPPAPPRPWPGACSSSRTDATAERAGRSSPGGGGLGRRCLLPPSRCSRGPPGAAGSPGAVFPGRRRGGSRRAVGRGVRWAEGRAGRGGQRRSRIAGEQRRGPGPRGVCAAPRAKAKAARGPRAPATWRAARRGAARGAP